MEQIMYTWLLNLLSFRIQKKLFYLNILNVQKVQVSWHPHSDTASGKQTLNLLASADINTDTLFYIFWHGINYYIYFFLVGGGRGRGRKNIGFGRDFLLTKMSALASKGQFLGTCTTNIVNL